MDDEDEGSYEDSLYQTTHVPKNSHVVGGQRIYICPVPQCGKQYQTAAGLRYHAKTIHNTTPRSASGETYKPSVYKCEVPGCDKIYSTMAGLRYHRKSGAHQNQQPAAAS